jgi:sugar lactone lactonase YvrE
MIRPLIVTKDFLMRTRVAVVLGASIGLALAAVLLCALIGAPAVQAAPRARAQGDEETRPAPTPFATPYRAENPLIGTDVSASSARPASAVSTPAPTPAYRQETLALWPVSAAALQADYPNASEWLGGEAVSDAAIYAALLRSARAAAARVPGLTVAEGVPIRLTGEPAALAAVRERLAGLPLLDHVSVGEVAPQPAPQDAPDGARSGLTLSLRTPWEANVAWGRAQPGAGLKVTLVRDGHVTTATARTDAAGRYAALLDWDILAGDVVTADDGSARVTLTVPALRPMLDANVSRLTASADEAGSLTATLGRVTRPASVSADGRRTFDLRTAGETAATLPGTPGFLRWTPPGAAGAVYQPLAAPIINVRRDTTAGMPYGDSHATGVSAIVWGRAAAESPLTVTLTRGSIIVSRAATADANGTFAISLDQIIQGGDVVQVSGLDGNGTGSHTVTVPALALAADPGTRQAAGTAPANITAVSTGAPHSLALTIGEHTYALTTGADGHFAADLSANPYLAGLLGGLVYTTPAGDRVYQPIVVKGSPTAAPAGAAGTPGDWRADVIVGQTSLAEISPNEVTANKVFNPGGVFVDRSAQPNRVYVFDSGNNRVLGLAGLGLCAAGARANQTCTANSDCPGSACRVQPDRSAEVVLGQPSMQSAACNGDSGYQSYPDVAPASAGTLCGLREEQTSILEGGSGSTMAADAQGNLYVADIFNSRVLRYDNPFQHDNVADAVWGQADMTGLTCNRGGSYWLAGASTLCFAPNPGSGEAFAGVAIDGRGSLWVADNQNNRVLRFPYSTPLGRPAPTADLILGQPDFTTIAAGTDPARMNKPTSVRVDAAGAVYVADSLNNRVLVFRPPFTNGMAASQILGAGSLQRPLGLELDLAGGLWVTDTGNNRLAHFAGGAQTTSIATGMLQGGVGIDADGNVLAALSGWEQQGVRYVAGAGGYTPEAHFLAAQPQAGPNQTGPRGLWSHGIGLEVAGGQLIADDSTRLLFWNNPWALTDAQPATGAVGEPDLTTRTPGAVRFGRMRADTHGRLWVVSANAANGQPALLAYQLPLTANSQPVRVIAAPLPLLGGGTWTGTSGLAVSGIDYQPACDCLWLADKDAHRAFRIRDAWINPVVDIVLGQRSATGMSCNQGRGDSAPSQDSLCYPGALALDPAGNLFLSDHNLEWAGNWRLLELDTASLPASAASTARFGVPASRVFGRDGSFTAAACAPFSDDPMCGPWEPAFDAKGRMVIGFNAYLGSRFPLVYQNPLANPLPVAALAEFGSMPTSLRFDAFDNLYALDHNRGRVLIYRDHAVPTYTASGAVHTQAGEALAGVGITVVGYAASASSGAGGAFTLAGLVPGTYTIMPQRQGYSFTPPSRTVSVPPAAGELDFVALPALPPTSASLTGPSDGLVGGASVFTAAVGPLNATLPITYAWQVGSLPAVTHTGGLTDTAAFIWDAPGLQTVLVTISNAAGQVTAAHRITVTLDGTLVAITAVQPAPPECVFRAAQPGGEGQTMLALQGQNIPAGNRQLQFQNTANGETSYSLDGEIGWIDDAHISVDMTQIEQWLWSGPKVVLRARVTTYRDGAYQPLSPWSPAFWLATDAAACPPATAPAAVSISGPTGGASGHAYAFTATVAPLTTTLPITYIWQAGDQPAVVHSSISATTDAYEASWPMGGVQTIVVTAINASGQAVGSASIELVVPPTAATISAPAFCLVGQPCVITADAAPGDVTRPLTFEWHGAGISFIPPQPIMRTTDTVQVTWSAAGTQHLEVVVTNDAGTASASRDVLVRYGLYLPVVTR